MNHRAAVATFLSLVAMVGMGAEIPKRHITCTAGSYAAGTNALVTCNFRKDMNDDRRPISVLRYPEGTTTDDPGQDVLFCQWQNEAQKYECELGKGFSMDGDITEHITLKLPGGMSNYTGLYSCFIMQAKETMSHACELSVKEGGNVTTVTSKHYHQKKGDAHLLWLIVIPVVFVVGMTGVVILYRRQRAMREEYRQVNHTMDHDDGRPPQGDENPCPNDLKCLVLSQKNIEKAVDLFHREVNASLKGCNEASDTSFVVPMKSLPKNSVNGAFLVVELTSTTLQIHLVRLQDRAEGGDSDKNVKIVGGSKSTKQDIPETVKLGTGRELFDFIAAGVKEFLETEKISRKKFRLVFVFSFPCKYDKDFTNAQLLKWTRGFRCDDVEGQSVKELLQGSFERNGVPKTIQTVAVVNNTVCTLVSVAHKDPQCKIALSLMDGFRAWYFPYQANQATCKPQTGIMATHFGGLGTSFADSLKTEWDRHLDERSVQFGKQTIEKMTSIIYIGEIVRKVLVHLIQNGRLSGCSPAHLSASAISEKNKFTADDVSMIESESDVRTYPITKLVLKRLGLNITEARDCETVRQVCRLVSNRAADLAAAGLAAAINALNQNEVSVAIEGDLKTYHASFVERLERNTRELVKEHLQFKLVPCGEGSSKGAALLGAHASPSFPRLPPNKTST